MARLKVSETLQVLVSASLVVSRQVFSFFWKEQIIYITGDLQ